MTRFLKSLTVSFLFAVLVFPAQAAGLKSIRIATVGVINVDETEALYKKWLDYKTVEKGVVEQSLALAWDAKLMAGKPYTLMAPAGNDQSYIRLVETKPQPGYFGLTTSGWNAIEIIVDDVDGLAERFEASPFRHLAGPANLGAKSTIRAFQVAGPSEEVIYFTEETGDRDNSTLPQPSGEVGRPFILILAGSDEEYQDGLSWYRTLFDLPDPISFASPVPVIAQAQRKEPDTFYDINLLRLGEFGYSIEMDNWGEGLSRRPVASGYLPQGNAIASFTVDKLDDEKLSPLGGVLRPAGVAYNGQRVIITKGPFGEILELIEE